jgi:hypothetical protein
MTTTTYLRITNWTDPRTPPITVVVEAASLRSEDPFEAVESYLDSGFFVTYDTFDGDDPVEASMRGAQHAADERQREHNMAVAYFWYVERLPMLVPTGLMAGTEPAPLSREDMAWVLRSVSRHEDYRGQRFRVPLADGTWIEMQDGEVLPA